MTDENALFLPPLVKLLREGLDGLEKINMMKCNLFVALVTSVLSIDKLVNHFVFFSSLIFRWWRSFL